MVYNSSRNSALKDTSCCGLRADSISTYNCRNLVIRVELHMSKIFKMFCTVYRRSTAVHNVQDVCDVFCDNDILVFVMSVTGGVRDDWCPWWLVSVMTGVRNDWYPSQLVPATTAVRDDRRLWQLVSLTTDVCDACGWCSWCLQYNTRDACDVVICLL
jgi:hypothetical protein